MRTRVFGIAILAGIILCAVTAAGQPEPRMDAREQEVLEFLEQNAPWAVPELEELRQHDPMAYRQHMLEIERQIRRYQELKEIEPEVAEELLRSRRLEHESWEIARRIADTADPGARAKLEAELRKNLDVVFDAKLAERELEIKHLQKELEEVRRNLEKRKQAREQIIDRRIETMLFEADEALGWW